MIVYDRHILCRAIIPPEAGPPLVVDPYVPLTLAVTGKLLEPIAGRNPKKIERCRRIQLLQFPLGATLQILGQLAGKTPMEQPFGFLAGKYLDHGIIVT